MFNSWKFYWWDLPLSLGQFAFSVFVIKDLSDLVELRLQKLEIDRIKFCLTRQLFDPWKCDSSSPFTWTFCLPCLCDRRPARSGRAQTSKPGDWLHKVFVSSGSCLTRGNLPNIFPFTWTFCLSFFLICLCDQRSGGAQTSKPGDRVHCVWAASNLYLPSSFCTLQSSHAFYVAA